MLKSEEENTLKIDLLKKNSTCIYVIYICVCVCIYIYIYIKDAITQLHFFMSQRHLPWRLPLILSLFMNEILCALTFCYSPKNFKVIVIHLVDLVSVSSLWDWNYK